MEFQILHLVIVLAVLAIVGAAFVLHRRRS